MNCDSRTRRLVWRYVKPKAPLNFTVFSTSNSKFPVAVRDDVPVVSPLIASFTAAADLLWGVGTKATDSEIAAARERAGIYRTTIETTAAGISAVAGIIRR
jgi:hypothetical protein